MKTSLLILSLFFSLNLSAKTLHKAKFDDKSTVAKKELILNGLGVRLATLFKVKVYVAGLYTEKKIKYLGQSKKEPRG